MTTGAGGNGAAFDASVYVEQNLNPDRHHAKLVGAIRYYEREVEALKGYPKLVKGRVKEDEARLKARKEQLSASEDRLEQAKANLASAMAALEEFEAGGNN